MDMHTVQWLLGGMGGIIVALLGVLAAMIWPRIRGAVSRDECGDCKAEMIEALETGDGAFGLQREATALIIQVLGKLCSAQGADCGDLAGELDRMLRKLANPPHRRKP